MKNIALTIVLMSVLVLTGCQAKTSLPATSTTQESFGAENAGSKTGNTTKKGTVTGQDGQYFLQVAGEQPIGIDSYAIDLDTYVGKTVTVTGQYSGNTLFVGNIQ